MADNKPETVIGKLLSVNSPTGALTFSGLVLMYVSAAALFLLTFYTYNRRDIVPVNIDFNNPQAVINYFLSAYSGQILFLLTAVISASIGYGLLRAAGTATKDTIPPKDYDLIKQMLLENNKEGIDSYVRLSSLSGMIGAFTKLGLPGLPLATIALTIFFAALAIIMQNTQISTSLFDLAKLTLGAFIGSYVQRSSSEVQRLIVAAQKTALDGQQASTDGTRQLQFQQTPSSAKNGEASGQAKQSEQAKAADNDEEPQVIAPVPMVDRAG